MTMARTNDQENGEEMLRERLLGLGVPAGALKPSTHRWWLRFRGPLRGSSQRGQPPPYHECQLCGLRLMKTKISAWRGPDYSEDPSLLLVCYTHLVDEVSER